MTGVGGTTPGETGPSAVGVVSIRDRDRDPHDGPVGSFGAAGGGNAASLIRGPGSIGSGRAGIGFRRSSLRPGAGFRETANGEVGRAAPVGLRCQGPGDFAQQPLS